MGTPFSALSFSGGKYVTAPHHARLDFTNESFVVNARFKGTAAGPIVNKQDSALALGWKVEAVAGGNARLTVNSTAISGGSILDGAWHDIECGRDSSSDKLLLFVDGLATTPVAFTPASIANSAAFQVGRSPDGASTLTGTVAEVRFSTGVRHALGGQAASDLSFTPPRTQFEDDGLTRLLWHFNEGKGSTIFDMSADALNESDYGTRQDGSTVGGTGTWAYGPLMANPARILHEGIWYALDVDPDLRAHGASVNLKRLRARPTDKSTGRILAAKTIFPSDFPGIFAFPQSVPGIPPETNAFDSAQVPITLMGGVINQGAFGASDLWWAVLRAVLRQETTDAGHFFHTRVQNWIIRRTVLNTTPLDDGHIASSFICEIMFDINCDLRTSGTP